MTPDPANLRLAPARAGLRRGFTIIEMMTVVVIIGIIAGVSLPAIKGLSQSHVVAAAAQQLEDDLNLARRMAITHHTTVYVLFVPTNIYSAALSSASPADQSALYQLLGKSYTSYALYEDRAVGSQPGQNDPRYLTVWKSLPDGVFIDSAKFAISQSTVPGATLDQYVPFLYKASAAFPLSSSAAFGPLPCLAFDYTGTLYNPYTGLPAQRDQVIPLDRGSIFYPADSNGNLLRLPPDVPQGGAASISTLFSVRVNWLNGRARIQKPLIQ